MLLHHLQARIFDIKTEDEFNQCALDVFRFQFENNPIYSAFAKHLNINQHSISHYTQIPFLPIEFFKTHTILSSSNTIEQTFQSSGTTGETTSKHHITDLSIYRTSFVKAFEQFMGKVNDMVILALLPSYKPHSSLVYMTQHLIQLSQHPLSSFVADAHELNNKLLSAPSNKQVVIIGVSHALLDYADQYTNTNTNVKVLETGGMKGLRKELVREELHAILRKCFSIPHIYSEYGMTELLSQAYSLHDGRFQTPHWMRISIRDTYDPRTLLPYKKRGGINIIDLANINSCAFIATQDLGLSYDDHSFEVLGRFDHSDVRGCNLLFQ